MREIGTKSKQIPTCLNLSGLSSIVYRVEASPFPTEREKRTRERGGEGRGVEGGEGGNPSSTDIYAWHCLAQSVRNDLREVEKKSGAAFLSDKGPSFRWGVSASVELQSFSSLGREETSDDFTS